MAAPDEKEQQLLLEFRQRITDLPLIETEQHDMFLITWIRAREHDLKKAEEMLRKHFEWQEAKDKTFENWSCPPGYNTRYAYELTGHDEQDCPVLVCKFGTWNVRKAIDDGEGEMLCQYLAYIAYSVRNHIRQMIEDKNKFISQFVLILDLKGLSYRQLASIKTVELYMFVLREFEANYPESLKLALVVNVNRFAVMAYNLVKPLLSDRTLAKVELYDSNASKWRSAILNKVPSHAIPVYYGGTKEGTHLTQICDNISSRKCGGEEYESRLTSVLIEAGSQFKIEQNVEQIGSILNWKFKTRKYDIGFSVLHNEREEIVPYARLDAGNDLHEGSIFCEAMGKYTLVFDNKYSRFRSKILEYRVIVHDQVS